MATMTDQLVGFSILGFSLVLFIYCSFWIIALPFIDSDHMIHSYFLPREYSVLLPLVAGLLLLLSVGFFISFMMWKSWRPEKKSE
uniref:Dolichol phosphate-mannose biosynthesis regulatory protein n=1 Tax=Geotrypetes seraphini TaxID=260995 RepID=A0A6P8SGK7_GEOSA|nr:dolichol phosphate-mannose biosynthesis regulatory protein [Geotrypetes seraphini]XP_033818033.1 dolichol phosphate-mannose biosynthesis regulatory protein [Geotrypetes seraphini]XP_033818034.1 dolichol phosphate-mannose biosynthesis regulatory protein [Geotrypetes seraphini]XP_033818035.1 dolichol phosphate-mannose biosynthesis regulatory protein [Geotrypetes seraphini]